MGLEKDGIQTFARLSLCMKPQEGGFFYITDQRSGKKKDFLHKPLLRAEKIQCAADMDHSQSVKHTSIQSLNWDC